MFDKNDINKISRYMASQYLKKTNFNFHLNSANNSNILFECSVQLALLDTYTFVHNIYHFIIIIRNLSRLSSERTYFTNHCLT